MKIKLFTRSWLKGIFSMLIFFGISSCVGQSEGEGSLPFEAYGRIDKNARSEVSGIVKSRKHQNVFWVHGDSGNDTKIFPINKNGTLASSGHSNGVKLVNTNETDWSEIDMDWEDIALDDVGNLVVADIGNNCLCRSDLSFLIFPEPELAEEEQTEYQRIKIRYPQNTGKKKFPGWRDSHSADAEAVFYRDGNIYLITKEKKGQDTRLFKLATRSETSTNTLVEVTAYHFDDKVTASDLSPSGDSLAVLTSSSAWLFTDFEGENFFSGTSKRVTFKATQVESVAFSGESSLIISEEEGQLYEISLSEFE